MFIRTMRRTLSEVCPQPSVTAKLYSPLCTPDARGSGVSSAQLYSKRRTKFPQFGNPKALPTALSFYNGLSVI